MSKSLAARLKAAEFIGVLRANKELIPEVLEWLSVISISLILLAIVLLVYMVVTNELPIVDMLEQTKDEENRNQGKSEVDNSEQQKPHRAMIIDPMAPPPQYNCVVHSVSDTPVSPSSWVSAPGSEGAIRYDPSYTPTRKYLSKEDVLQQCASDPRVLIGWVISVRVFGQGTVLDIEKDIFRRTTFKVKFQDHSDVKKVPLKRGPRKGSIEFELIHRKS